MLTEARRSRSLQHTKSVQSQINDIIENIVWYREYIANISKAETTDDLQLAVERWILENSDPEEVIERDASVYLGYVRLRTQERKLLNVPIYVTLTRAAGIHARLFNKNQINDIKKYSQTTSLSELAKLYNTTQDKIKEIIQLPNDITEYVGSHNVYISVGTFLATERFIHDTLVHEIQHCTEREHSTSTKKYNKIVRKFQTDKPLTFRDYIHYMQDEGEFNANLIQMTSSFLAHIREQKRNITKEEWKHKKQVVLRNLKSVIDLNPENLQKEFDEKIKVSDVPFDQSMINNMFVADQLLIYTSAFSKKKWGILINKLRDLFTVVKYS
jgi:hypothetical protein